MTIFLPIPRGSSGPPMGGSSNLGWVSAQSGPFGQKPAKKFRHNTRRMCLCLHMDQAVVLGLHDRPILRANTSVQP